MASQSLGKSLKLPGIAPSSHQKFKARKQVNLLLERLNKKPINNSRINSNKYFKSNFLLINAASNTKHFLEFPFEFFLFEHLLEFPTRSGSFCYLMFFFVVFPIGFPTVGELYIWLIILIFLSGFLDEQILNERSRPRQFDLPQQIKITNQN